MAYGKKGYGAATAGKVARAKARSNMAARKRQKAAGAPKKRPVARKKRMR